MLDNTLKILQQKRGVITFFLLTYVDKVVSFALPLAVLFILQDQQLYSLIEAVFSYAAIAMVMAELGISNYLFWGYKEAVDKHVFIGKAKLFFKAILTFYSVILVLALIYLKEFHEGLFTLFTLASIRTLFTFYVNFNSNICRLLDSPSKIYLVTIVTNIASFLLLIAAYQFFGAYSPEYFFLPSLVLILGGCVKFLSEIRSFHFTEFKSFLADALSYSWPIILNVLAMTFINNYAKIYAYGHLSEGEMVEISYVMRVGLIVQLSHTAFASYFSKALFMDEKLTFNKKKFLQYSLVLLFSAILVVVAILSTNFLWQAHLYIPLNLTTGLFLLYIVLWCYIGYLELYFGRVNANRLVLYFSIASSALYIFLLRINDGVNMWQLGCFMAISAVANLLMVIIGMYRLKLFAVK